MPSSSPQKQKQSIFRTNTAAACPGSASTLLRRRTSSNNNATPSTRTTSSSSNSNRRTTWWQQSVVQRTVSYIKEEFDHVVSQSPFLQQQQQLQDEQFGGSSSSSNNEQQQQQLGFFHRSEIITGRVLGKGGFSEVYEIIAFQLRTDISNRCSNEQNLVRRMYANTVRNATTGQYQYAIKYLQSSLLQHPKEFERAAADLTVEAAYMSLLDHPNILAAKGLPIDGLDSYSDGKHDSYFIITDRLDTTLDKQIQQWRTTATTATVDEPTTKKAALALQLANALQHLHERRIVFRDLKPANIGISSNGCIQLFDFGLCRQLPSPAQQHNIHGMYEMSGVGTRRYMAPEIVTTGLYNCKADVYSWSLVVWEMYFTTKPYEILSMMDHRVRVCENGERPYLPPPPSSSSSSSFPVVIGDILESSWDRFVSQRLSMKEVCHYLGNYVNEERQQQHRCNLKTTTRALVPMEKSVVTINNSSNNKKDELLLLPSLQSLSDDDSSGVSSFGSDHDDYVPRTSNCFKFVMKTPPPRPTAPTPTTAAPAVVLHTTDNDHGDVSNNSSECSDCYTDFDDDDSLLGVDFLPAILRP